MKGCKTAKTGERRVGKNKTWGLDKKKYKIVVITKHKRGEMTKIRKKKYKDNKESRKKGEVRNKRKIPDKMWKVQNGGETEYKKVKIWKEVEW